MTQWRAAVWCRAMRRQVLVVLEEAPPKTPDQPYIPQGWRICECLEKGLECCDVECPLVTASRQEYQEVSENMD